MKRRPLIVPLEERIVLDAAAAAVVAHVITTAHEGASHHADQTHTTAPPTNVIYVNANATGTTHDGTSWNTAYVNLQDALNKAASTSRSDQIWVAKGTYTPTQIYSPLDANGHPVAGGAAALDPSVTNLDLNAMKTFNIPDNVQIYGGFTGKETSILQRDPVHNATILSGGGVDWHVVTMGDDITQTGVNATLDGLTISGGNATGPDLPFGSYQYNHSFGGGAYIAFDSNVVINDVTFTHNFAASDGGGLYTNSSNILVTNSEFLDNTAVVRAGAYEALNTWETSPTDATINTPHTATVINSVFDGNTSYVFGGAIVGEGTFASHQSALNIIDSTFTNNTAAEGGAVTIDSLNVNVIHSTFTDNSSTVSAGALATTSVVNSLFGGPRDFVTTITDSTFLHNTTQGSQDALTALNNNFNGFIPGLTIDFSRGGGALVSYMAGRLVVKDSTFIGNTALSGDGGAILDADAIVSFYGVAYNTGASTTVTHSLFLGNQALDGSGGAIAANSPIGLQDPTSLFTTTVDVKWSIFAGNTASVNGGAISLNGANATIKGNIFTPWDNADGTGDQIFGIDSNINGHLSDTLQAEKSLIWNNIIFLLNNDDIVLS